MRCGKNVRKRTLFLRLREDSTCACNECNFMRLNTLEKLYNTLKYEWPEVNVDEAIAQEAIKPIQKMLEISAKLRL